MRPFPYSIVPAIVGSLVCFVLLILATISSPMVDTIYFLKLITAPDEPEPLPSNTTVTFGVFGMSSNDGRRSLVSLGYSPSNWSGLGVDDPTVNQPSLKSITYALILHPIGAFLAIIAFGFSTIGLCSRTGAVFSTLVSLFLSILLLTIFIIDIVFFSILKSQFTDAPYERRRTEYGNALWIVLVALLAAVVCAGSSFWTAFVGRNRYPRRKWANRREY
ncbi:hypothetical protein FRC15_007169 [Serendipita sp. 397]|nr:hypothetical protein FRC15_007169 [Serendipita sp. 397]